MIPKSSMKVCSSMESLRMKSFLTVDPLAEKSTPSCFDSPKYGYHSGGPVYRCLSSTFVGQCGHKNGSCRPPTKGTKIGQLLCSEIHYHIWAQATQHPRNCFQPMTDHCRDTKAGLILRDIGIWLKGLLMTLPKLQEDTQLTGTLLLTFASCFPTVYKALPAFLGSLPISSQSFPLVKFLHI